MTTGEDEEASSSEPSNQPSTTVVSINPAMASINNNNNTAMDISANLSYSILPLLQMQPVTNLTKHDINNLVKTILSMEPYILNYDLSFNNDHIGFFAPFVALSTNCIISNASAIPKSQVQLTSNACSILIQYILHYLQVCDERSLLTKVNNLNPHPNQLLSNHSSSMSRKTHLLTHLFSSLRPSFTASVDYIAARFM